MSFCSKCGKQLSNEEKFCDGCGTPVGQNSSGSSDSGSSGSGGSGNSGSSGGGFMNTPNSTSEFDPSDVNDNKGISVCSYLGILFLVPLLGAPNSKFARFHANQGLLLFICEIGGLVAAQILTVIFGLISLGFLGSLISFAVSASVIALMIIGIINVTNGQAKELPIIGGFKLIK